MDSRNRNTFLMLGIAFIASLVALFLVLSFTWNIISSPVEYLANQISKQQKVYTTNYNFEIPSVDSEEQNNNNNNSQQLPVDEDNKYALRVNPSDENHNYNFRVPKRPEVNTTDFRVRDAIIDDARLAGYGTGYSAPQSKLSIQIPKIGVNSPAWQGLGATDLLERGFWVYPASSNPGVGEIIMLCHRRYFGPNDPRSCWNLDKIVNNDSIYMVFQETAFEYKVTNVQVYEANDPAIYKIDNSKDSIRIVTCTPLYSDTHRLVVYAERV